MVGLGVVLLWIVLIGLAILLVRGRFQSNRSNRKNPPLFARQILERAYAKGEISREEYLLMMRDIS
jgi:uncharacterized membrane protein